MEWTFSYTIDDYLEATRALKKPSRGTKRSHEALWVGLGTALFALALLLLLGTTTKESTAGYIESSHASTFATILLPTGTLLGFAWAIFVPSTDTVNRGPLRRCLLIMLLSCVLGAGVGALDPPPPSLPAGQGDGVKGTLISLIPFAIMFVGLCVGAFPMLRWARRNACAIAAATHDSAGR